MTRNSVLVVEDSPINMKLAVSMLERLGLEVHSANNGLEAIKAIEEGLKPDLILMDLQMPVMDGIEATIHMHKNFDPCPSIVAMTANVDNEYYIECNNAGMVDFIEKPIRLAKLKEILPRHIPKLLIYGNTENWIDETHATEKYQHINIELIEKDFSECWDIFYKFYREFIHYYQDSLPLLERAIKHQDSLDIRRASKEFLGLTAYFHPSRIKQSIEKMRDEAMGNDFQACLKSFKVARNQAQEIIREVSYLLSNEPQKFSQ